MEGVATSGLLLADPSALIIEWFTLKSENKQGVKAARKQLTPSLPYHFLVLFLLRGI